MSSVVQPISEADKRAAFEGVLNSRTFERSDQLKSFLAFVCEEELAGRGEQLNEYQIGVAALGRPDDYTPASDAIVRNRAHTLRRKLEEYYTHENPNSAIRIDVPRGSYQPHFLVVESPPAPAPEAVPVVAGPDVAVPKRTLRLVLLAVAGFAMGVAVASLGWWLATAPAGVNPVLKEAWGPLLARDAQTTIHISAPLHLFVRPTETRLPGVRPEVNPEVLQFWYRQFPSLPPAQNLFLRPTPNSLLWGDALGALTAGRVLSAAGVRWDVLPTRLAGAPVLRHRNVILFGRPEYSREAATILQGLPLTVEYHPDLREYGILERASGTWWLPKYVANDEAEVVYGLITVVPSEGSPSGEHRSVLLTGSNSAGIQAAAEFFSSPREMEALRSRFADRRFPPSYQVVVKATASATMALDIYYVKHAVVRQGS